MQSFSESFLIVLTKPDASTQCAEQNTFGSHFFISSRPTASIGGKENFLGVYLRDVTQTSTLIHAYSRVRYVVQACDFQF